MGKEYRRNNTGANRQHKVNPEERALMHQMRTTGMTPGEIAQSLNRAQSCVYRHLHQGGKHPRWTDEENQILVDGYLSGHSVKEISRKLPGRSEVAIRVAWWRHRKKAREDPKKQYTLSMITRALRAVRKADIYRELEVFEDEV